MDLNQTAAQQRRNGLGAGAIPEVSVAGTIADLSNALGQAAHTLDQIMVKVEAVTGAAITSPYPDPSSGNKAGPEPRGAIAQLALIAWSIRSNLQRVQEALENI